VTGDEGQAPIELDVPRGNPTAEELAALIAVVTEAYAHEVDSATAPTTPTDVWGLAARPIRSPLRRDVPFGRFVG
jgi:phenylpyruvate tautomerase PptA (4-oxalocrotonate tautomerase family)